jgi:scavenger receptor class B, member 1
LTGDFNVNTGADSIFKVGQLRKWNFEPQTKFFQGKCSQLSGSAGDIFPPGMTKDEIVSLFSPEMCRSIPLEFEEEAKIHGVNVFKYVSGDRTVDNGTLYPENKCYCSGDCVPSGLFNVSSCRYGTPVFMSFPHFYKADPFYTSQVDGMKPDKSRHEFSMSFEPVRKTNPKNSNLFMIKFWFPTENFITSGGCS